MNVHSNAAGAYGINARMTPQSDSIQGDSVLAAMLLDPRNMKKQAANGMVSLLSFFCFHSSLQ